MSPARCSPSATFWIEQTSWTYFWSVDSVEVETSLDSSLPMVMATLTDVEIRNAAGH